MTQQRDDRAERAVLAVLARNRGELDASVLARLLAGDVGVAGDGGAHGVARADLPRTPPAAVLTKPV